MTNMKIRVAAAFILDEHGHFLIAQRSKGMLAGKWEFPGGKLEEGETDEMAIIREIEEELGVVVKPIKTIGVFNHQLVDLEIELVLIKCDLLPNQNIVSDGSHLQHAWIRLSEYNEYDFTVLDKELVQFLEKTGEIE